MTEGDNELQSWADFLDEIISFKQDTDKIDPLDNTCFATLKQEADATPEKILQLLSQRPDCLSDGSEYEIKFKSYRRNVDELNGHRLKLLAKLKTIAQSQSTIEHSKYYLNLIVSFTSHHQEDPIFSYKLQEYFKEVQHQLISLTNSLETFTKNQITDSQKLYEKLESSNCDVDRLRTETHEWEPVEYRAIPSRAKQIVSETSSPNSRPEEERRVVITLRCTRCGLTKRAGSNGIG